ncbi:cobalt-precorrin-5B (C(1))-methyltransferase [Arsenicicoccus piscis]|uniref:Cobalt-precorrin-5B C(1)-methyltransferase n=1 Tax=Arsenicicoccus piscis TaxID=673954 RepID=A0ABQ6HP41_9MICO|nr:cobalt-precorrin-5B (C(1))-methyltransferase [Arsenicicoccus piscis]MCH8628513.1 cobalt-precorrin-5B (C(1))-methyltransferase [Arsenicicoccus piscis]GMA19910.1 cobalt-precorrin-5B C(1)-methyltransferase [Arsenicicoccus piscis]
MSEHAHAPRGGRAGQIDSTGLRPGWTTGACATAAARAAWEALLTGSFPDPVDITLPRGQRPTFALTDERVGDDWAEAAVTKDAGDDPDVTHLAVVRVRVRRGPAGSGTRFVAGHGVGTVTLPGLPLEVGEPAINPVPRQMIRHTLREAEASAAGRAEALAWDHGPQVDAVVEISVDQGEEMARHTWNPRLGILGGLSILGTTGIVVPYSCSAWIDSIRRGIDVAEALGIEHVAGCTGSTSERVVTELYGLPEQGLLDMGDFVGAVLKHLRTHPRPRLTIAGGFAKLSKLAAGHLDLHSGRSQVDPAHLTRLAESCGAPSDLVAQLAGVNTGLEALQLSQAAGVPLGDAVAETAREQALRVLDGAPVVVDVVCIDRAGMIVGRCAPAGPRS